MPCDQRPGAIGRAGAGPSRKPGRRASLQLAAPWRRPVLGYDRRIIVSEATNHARAPSASDGPIIEAILQQFLRGCALGNPPK